MNDYFQRVLMSFLKKLNKAATLQGKYTIEDIKDMLLTSLLDVDENKPISPPDAKNRG